MNSTLTAPSPAKPIVLATSEDLHRLQKRIPSLITVAGYPTGHPVIHGPAGGTRDVTLAHQSNGTMTVRHHSGIIHGIHKGRGCTYLVRRVGARYRLEVVK